MLPPDVMYENRTNERQRIREVRLCQALEQDGHQVAAHQMHRDPRVAR